MLATLMTALFFMVRAFGRLGTNLFHKEPLPYLAYQPLPWQVQCVTQNRRASREGERRGSSRNDSICSLPERKGTPAPEWSRESPALYTPTERAAVTIQTRFRQYKQQEPKSL